MTRRTIFKLLAFVLAGAIINVAVAWGFVIESPGSAEIHVRALSSVEREWLGSQWDLAMHPLECRVLQWRHERTTQLIVQGTRGPTSGVGAEMRAGFPTLSLVGYFKPNCSGPRSWDVNHLPWDSVGFWAYDDGFPHTTLGKVLPLIPIWPGFAINTIFYAAILWMVFAVPRYIKRRRRIKRGLCARCAYPIGTAENCTECGGTVQRPGS
jgi:hypothetical protein